MTSTHRLMVASVLSLFALSAGAARLWAEVKENPKVDQLAHEGYWLKDQEQAYKPAMAMLKKPAPALDLSEWHGNAVAGAGLKGKIVLIDFWATWCGPCLAQIPHANAMAKKYADKGVVVFGACCSRGADRMANTATDRKMEYPTGKLNDKDTAAWHIAFWPTYAIIDREGKLRAIGLEPEYVEKVLDELLIEQPGEEKK
jgi:thiol-disulfide isomerase/thioredoxin